MNCHDDLLSTSFLARVLGRCFVLQESLDLGKQLRELHGLSVLVGAADFQGPVPVPRHGVGGQGNDG